MFRLRGSERLNCLFIAMARLAQYSPKGKFRLTAFFLKLASDGYSTPSIYGPLLQNRWHDTTFRFCVVGYYGDYFSNVLRQFPSAFSFLDIGANIGLYSLIAAANRRCKKCYSFEPNPLVYQSLVENVRINNAWSVQTFNCAVSDSERFMDFLANDSHSGAGAIVNTDTLETIKIRSVGARVFDEIAGMDRNPKIIKIDVEGHEPIVIRELMKSAIWADILFLFFEANGNRYNVKSLVDEITSAGLTKIHEAQQAGDTNLMFARTIPNNPNPNLG